MTSSAAAAPIRGVLFDLHCTLVDQGSSDEWLARAWEQVHGSEPPSTPDAERLRARLHLVWENAREIDPANARDLDADRHREVFNEVLREYADEPMRDALRAVMLDLWHPYDDAVPVLKALRSRGVRVAVLSNVGIDVRPVLDRGGITPLVDAVVLSYEVGTVKPDPRIFEHALAAIDVRAHEALMVGDAWRDDGAAAALGVRTLLLPRTHGPIHGLDAVLRLVG